MVVVPLSDSRYVHREKLYDFYDTGCIRVVLTPKSRDYFSIRIHQMKRQSTVQCEACARNAAQLTSASLSVLSHFLPLHLWAMEVPGQRSHSRASGIAGLLATRRWFFFLPSFSNHLLPPFDPLTRGRRGKRTEGKGSDIIRTLPVD